jgi:branched-chain amino acid transport system ATP-binding protein
MQSADDWPAGGRVLLSLRGVSVSYQGLEVVHEIDMSVSSGQFVALIGINGSGRSSIMKAIVGIVPYSNGVIAFDGEDLAPGSRKWVGRQGGIALVPEGRELFPRLSVFDNLRMGAFRNPKAFQRQLGYLTDLFPVLGTRARQLVGTLSGGEQQMVAIGRGLISEPKVLLLDEPSLGLAPRLVEVLFEAVKKLSHQGVAVLMAEQVYAGLLSADFGYIVESGRLVAGGPTEQLANDQRMRQIYLGVS